LAGLGAAVPPLLDSLQAALLDRARRFLAENTTRVKTYEEFKEVMATKRGFILAGWNGDPTVEAKIKDETKATIRVMAIDEVRETPCVVTGQPGREVYFAQAY
jgi:prolyl-tRNA synthetase